MYTSKNHDMKTSNNLPSKEVHLLQQQIKTVALERFAHFGIEKTTMYEIANVVGISSSCLATHFANKNQLISEISKELILQENIQLAQHISKHTSTLQAFYKLLEIKDKTRKKYKATQLTYRYKKMYGGLPESVVQLIKKVEIKQVQMILKRGIKRGELMSFPVKRVAEVFAEMLYGVVLAGGKLSEILSVSHYPPEEVLEKQKEITNIFVNGLRVPATITLTASAVPSF